MGDNTKLRSKELVRLARTELAREQADVLAFVNKNRGGCDALSYDLTNFVDAVGVGARATFTFARETIFEPWRQLDYFSILVSECKDVGLLFHELVLCLARSDLRQFFVPLTVIRHLYVLDPHAPRVTNGTLPNRSFSISMRSRTRGKLHGTG
jgi:hypothetical protein